MTPPRPSVMSVESIRWAKTAPAGVIGARVRITGGSNPGIIAKYGWISRHGFIGTKSFYDVRLEGVRNESVIILTKFCRILIDNVGLCAPAAVPQSVQPRASRSLAANPKSPSVCREGGWGGEGANFGYVSHIIRSFFKDETIPCSCFFNTSSYDSLYH
jgi:hypothetical protein